MILSEDERRSLADSHPEWELDGESIRRVFQFDDFTGSVAFVVRVGFLAEAADHHPDIDVRWNKVSLALTTHHANGLTEKDTALATQIDALV